MEDEIFRSATRGFSRLFSLNLFSKILTFTFNTAIIRQIHPEAKGLERTFDAVVNMALFLQREAVRNALQRQKPLTRDLLNDPKQRLAQLITLGWLMVPWGLVCTLLVSTLHTYSTMGEQYQDVGSLRLPLLLYAAAVLVEVAAEPAYLLTQNLLLFDVRVVLEGSALLAKTVFTWGMLRFVLSPALSARNTLVLFGVAQCLHSLVLLVGYNGYYLLRRSRSREVTVLVDSKWKLLPHSIRGCAWIDFEQFRATYEMWVESLLRCVLQEGEKWVMMTYVLLVEQGAYDVVSNLGSLVARMLFKFVEDIALTAWSKLLGDGAPSVVAVQKCARFYALLAKFMVLIGLIFLVFGVPYCEALLYILYSTRWLTTTAPQLLRWYCVYVCCMGLCGISEAFVRAVANSGELHVFKSFQLFCGLSYLFLLYILSTHYGYGSVGVVAANIISMAVRAFYCLRFALGYFATHNARQHFSVAQFTSFSRETWAVLAVATVAVRCSEAAFPFFRDGAARLSWLVLHVGVGLLCFAATGLALYWKDRDFLQALRRLWRSENLD
eukprot:EG_transcript_8489